MKHVTFAIAVSFLLINAAAAEEVTQHAAKADSATEDCSKQVWPNFFPPCLRNADRAINVRLVTVSRR
jgi:hypothetical protein